MTSLRRALESVGVDSIGDLRARLGLADNVSCQVVEYPLHIIAYNVAFVDAVGHSLHDGSLPDGVDLNRDRLNVPEDTWFVDRICERIRAANADIVCLCEVFLERARSSFKEQLADLYPHTADGPTNEPRRLTPQDSGLLVLSQRPIEAVHRFAYPAAGPLDLGEERIDTLAAKGVVHVRVEVTSGRFADVFLTHLQALYDDVPSIWEPLRAQLDDLGWFARAVSGVRVPALIVGDLNVDASNAPRYQEMLETLEDFVDVWPIVRPDDPGFTWANGNNFTGSPRTDSERLDYVLQRSAPTMIPMVDDMRVLRWQAEGRDLSDHFPLEVVCRSAIVFEPRPVEISEVRVRILRFRTLRTATQKDRVGSRSADRNQIRFTLKARSASGARGESAIRINTTTGFEPGFDLDPLVLPAPGDFVDLEVFGEELNAGWFDDTDLGTQSVRLEREDLWALANATRRICLPRFTREDGDYAVELEVSARAV